MGKLAVANFVMYVEHCEHKLANHLVFMTSGHTKSNNNKK